MDITVVARIPSAILAYCVALLTNLRTRTALLAFFFGTFGVDMLYLRPHQQRLFLFLFLGGPLLAVAVVCAILSFTHGTGSDRGMYGVFMPRHGG